MNRARRHNILVAAVGLFILYNFVSCGGCVIERSDSLATLGVVTEAQLTKGASVYLKETATTRCFFVPFLFYYYRNTYPFRLRFYGSTQDGNTEVTDREIPGRETNVVVTEVLYHRQPDDAQASADPHVFNTTTWGGITIPEPGEWIVESRGYVKTKGGKEPLTFPQMTIRQTQHGRIRVQGFLNHFLSSIP